jgi:hypothetical protein
MRHLVVGILAFFCISSCMYAQAIYTEPQRLTLRVTSSSDKPVSFIASMFFKTDKARLDYTTQTTPYEITVQSNYLNATIIKTSGEGDLVVNLIKSRKVGDQPNLKASSSSIVVVGTQDADKAIYYEHTF